MLYLRRPDVDVGSQEIPGKPVVVISVYRGRLIEQPRQTIVRYVVFALMQVTEGRARGAPQSKGKRRSDTGPAILCNIPSRNVADIAHCIQAKGSSLP